MFQQQGRQNQNSRLTSANLQVHAMAPQNGIGNFDNTRMMQSRTDAAAAAAQMNRNYSYPTLPNSTAQNVAPPQSRSPYWRSERIDSHRPVLRGNDGETETAVRATFDPMTPFHRSHVDDDLESTITSASGYLGETSNIDDSRPVFDPYNMDNAPQTPGSVHTAISSLFQQNCDSTNALPSHKVAEISGTQSMHENSQYWMNEQRTRMRNQAENIIDPTRSHNVDVTNSNWSPSSAWSARQQLAKHDGSMRRELTAGFAQQSAPSQQLNAFGDSRKRPFLANADCSNDFNTANGQFSNGGVAQKRERALCGATADMYSCAVGQQPNAGANANLKAAALNDNSDAFLAPPGPLLNGHQFLYGTKQNNQQENLNDNASCAEWAPAPSPAPPFSSTPGFQANWNRNQQCYNPAQRHFQQPIAPEDEFSAPASPTSPFKLPGHAVSGATHPLSNVSRSDIEARYKEYDRNNSLIEKFGLNFSGRSPPENFSTRCAPETATTRPRSNRDANNTSNGPAKSGSENLFEAVNEFIGQHGKVTQKTSAADQASRGGRRSDPKQAASDNARSEASKETAASARLRIKTSDLLDQYQATREFKKPDEYRSEAKRLKHYADSLATTRSGPTDVQNLMITLVKVGTYTEAVLAFALCASAMESKPEKYKPEQCAEFYADLLPLVQYVRQLAQTYQATRSSGEQSRDPLSDLLFYGVHSISYLIDWYLHVKMFDARKGVLETSLQRIDEMKTTLRGSARASSMNKCNMRSSANDMNEISDAVSSASMSSGYVSNSSSPLIHRRAASGRTGSSTTRSEADERGYSKEGEKSKQRADIGVYSELSEQYEAALQDMALMCRAFDLREEAMALVQKLQSVNVVSEGEHKRKWKRIVNVSKWPCFSVQHLALADFVAFVRTFVSTLMGTALATLPQCADKQSVRSKR